MFIDPAVLEFAVIKVIRLKTFERFGTTTMKNWFNFGLHGMVSFDNSVPKNSQNYSEMPHLLKALGVDGRGSMGK